MARRADHTHKEIAEMAVAAGQDLLREHGFASFSARQVAARIGYTIGTLYNVFGSYDALLLHINAKTLDAWYEALNAARLTADAPDRIDAIAQAYIAFSQANPRVWTALFEHHPSPETALPDWYQAKMARFFTMTEEEVVKIMPASPQSAAQATRILWAGIHGIATLSLAGKLAITESDPPEALARLLVLKLLRDWV